MPNSIEVSGSSSGPTVHLEIIDDGTIAVLTLDDFKGTNVMSQEMGDAFSRHIALLQKDATVRAVIIRGAGKNFSIGGHRDMLIGLGKPGRSEKELHDFMLDFYNRWLPVLDLPVPVLASASGRLHRCGAGICLRGGYRVRGRNAQVADHVCGARSLSGYGAADSSNAEGGALPGIVADNGQ